jgi:hypothetical protein
MTDEIEGTPRTETAIYEYADGIWRKWVKADFARQLEREIEQLTDDRDRYCDEATGHVLTICDLREEIRELKLLLTRRDAYEVWADRENLAPFKDKS